MDHAIVLTRKQPFSFFYGNIFEQCQQELLQYGCRPATEQPLSSRCLLLLLLLLLLTMTTTATVPPPQHCPTSPRPSTANFPSSSKQHEHTNDFAARGKQHVIIP
jgi:hypothetical protein